VTTESERERREERGLRDGLARSRIAFELLLGAQRPLIRRIG